jgi:hypothetical protein
MIDADEYCKGHFAGPRNHFGKSLYYYTRDIRLLFVNIVSIHFD